jgi:hypothetical protein
LPAAMIPTWLAAYVPPLHVLLDEAG